MALTYEKIQTTTLGSAQATVTFSSISGSYTDLVVIINFGSSSSGQDFCFRFNGDTGNNYSNTRMFGNGTNAISSRTTNNNKLEIDSIGVSTTLTVLHTIQVMNYSNATTYKSALMKVADAGKGADANVGMWRNTAAITSLDFFMTSGNILSGSTFTLYGIKAE